MPVDQTTIEDAIARVADARNKLVRLEEVLYKIKAKDDLIVLTSAQKTSLYQLYESRKAEFLEAVQNLL